MERKCYKLSAVPASFALLLLQPLVESCFSLQEMFLLIRLGRGVRRACLLFCLYFGDSIAEAPLPDLIIYCDVCDLIRVWLL